MSQSTQCLSPVPNGMKKSTSTHFCYRLIIDSKLILCFFFVFEYRLTHIKQWNWSKNNKQKLQIWMCVCVCVKQKHHLDDSIELTEVIQSNWDSHICVCVCMLLIYVSCIPSFHYLCRTVCCLFIFNNRKHWRLELEIFEYIYNVCL